MLRDRGRERTGDEGFDKNLVNFCSLEDAGGTYAFDLGVHFCEREPPQILLGMLYHLASIGFLKLG